MISSTTFLGNNSAGVVVITIAAEILFKALGFLGESSFGCDKSLFVDGVVGVSIFVLREL